MDRTILTTNYFLHNPDFQLPITRPVHMARIFRISTLTYNEHCTTSKHFCPTKKIYSKYHHIYSHTCCLARLEKLWVAFDFSMIKTTSLLLILNTLVKFIMDIVTHLNLNMKRLCFFFRLHCFIYHYQPLLINKK